VYNTDFLPLLEESRRALFGSMPSSPVLPCEDVRSLAHAPARGQGLDDTSRYMPPREMKMLQCHENRNGELVPIVDKEARSHA